MGWKILNKDGTLSPLNAPAYTPEEVKIQATEGVTCLVDALQQMMSAKTLKERNAAVKRIRDLALWTSARWLDMNQRAAS